MADQDCRYCGEPVWSENQTRSLWLLLNRYGVGTGKFRSLTSVENDDGECVWDVGGEEDLANGVVLHWPICANAWIEGKMIEANVGGRQMFGDPDGIE